jgi:peroxiredoxin
MSVEQSNSPLDIGEKAPKFSLEDYMNEEISLSDLENYDGVLVLFMCNHCPFVQANLPEISRLSEEYSSIAFVGINTNAGTHPMDSKEKMPELVDEYGLDQENFYYLVDSTQEVAEEYGAVCTPDPFLLDMRHKLFYHGRITDKMGPNQQISERNLQQAIDKMLKSKNPPEEQPESKGCSIKWSE